MMTMTVMTTINRSCLDMERTIHKMVTLGNGEYVISTFKVQMDTTGLLDPRGWSIALFTMIGKL